MKTYSLEMGGLDKWKTEDRSEAYVMMVNAETGRVIYLMWD